MTSMRPSASMRCAWPRNGLMIHRALLDKIIAQTDDPQSTHPLSGGVFAGRVAGFTRGQSVGKTGAIVFIRSVDSYGDLEFGESTGVRLVDGIAVR